MLELWETASQSVSVPKRTADSQLPGLLHPLCGGCFSSPAKFFDRALPVSGLTVLAQFRFSNNPGDVDFDANDGGELLVDVILVSVAHFPWFGSRLSGASFVNLSERGHRGAKESGVFNEANPAVDMNNLVIPGRDLAVRFVFAGIPVG